MEERRILSDMAQRTLFDLTQDGLVIGRKLERIYPDFDTHTFVKDVRTEMEGQTIYNVTKAVGRVLRHHLPKDYSDALAILMKYVDAEIPAEPSPSPSEELQTSLRPISHFVSLQSEADEPQTILTHYVVSYKRPTGHVTRKRYRVSQRKLKPKQKVSYDKSLFPLPSLKQYHDGKACLGWHRFELEVNGDAIGSFDFETIAETHRRESH